MRLNDNQIRAIETNAIHARDYDLATLAHDALVSPTARALVQGRHVPCGECGEPVSDAALVAAQDARIASFPGPAPAVTTEARAHNDCDHPELGVCGAAEGYTPAGVA